jgi:aryl-alcohol dehydrogenase-like predicted oxidoreductase
MRYRQLGKTGWQISEIGFGAWGIGGAGWIGARDHESLSALREALDAGVNFIDTALAYGSGHSEALVGQAVRESRNQVYVATKIPPRNGQLPAVPHTPVQDAFPPQHIIACTERSLRHLKRDHIDLQQFHVWRDEWLSDRSWLEALLALKAEGKIRAIGVSINHHEPQSALKLVRSGLIDSVQVIYNIFDQSPARTLFPTCQEAGVGVLVRVPLDEGGLTGSITPATAFPPGDFRNAYFAGPRKAQVEAHVKPLLAFLGAEAHTLPELALRFCLAHPAVSTVMPGMRTSKHVLENCGVSGKPRLSEGLLSELKRHAWPRNFYAGDPGILGAGKRLLKKALPSRAMALLAGIRNRCGS